MSELKTYNVALAAGVSVCIHHAHAVRATNGIYTFDFVPTDEIKEVIRAFSEWEMAWYTYNDTRVPYLEPRYQHLPVLRPDDLTPGTRYMFWMARGHVPPNSTPFHGVFSKMLGDAPGWRLLEFKRADIGATLKSSIFAQHRTLPPNPAHEVLGYTCCERDWIFMPYATFTPKLMVQQLARQLTFVCTDADANEVRKDLPAQAVTLVSRFAGACSPGEYATAVYKAPSGMHVAAQRLPYEVLIGHGPRGIKAMRVE